VCGGREGRVAVWGLGRMGEADLGRGVGVLDGRTVSGAAGVDWLVGFGDATRVGVGDLLGVYPRYAFVPQANLGLWDGIPLGLAEEGEGAVWTGWT